MKRWTACTETWAVRPAASGKQPAYATEEAAWDALRTEAQERLRAANDRLQAARSTLEDARQRAAEALAIMEGVEEERFQRFGIPSNAAA